MSDYEVTLVNDSMQEFYVTCHGPDDSKFFWTLSNGELYSYLNI
jgi:hypothetical protein